MAAERALTGTRPRACIIRRPFPMCCWCWMPRAGMWRYCPQRRHPGRQRPGTGRQAAARCAARRAGRTVHAALIRDTLQSGQTHSVEYEMQTLSRLRQFEGAPSPGRAGGRPGGRSVLARHHPAQAGQKRCAARVRAALSLAAATSRPSRCRHTCRTHHQLLKPGVRAAVRLHHRSPGRQPV